MGACLYGYVLVRSSPDPLYTLLPHTTEEFNNNASSAIVMDNSVVDAKKAITHRSIQLMFGV